MVRQHRQPAPWQMQQLFFLAPRILKEFAPLLPPHTQERVQDQQEGCQTFLFLLYALISPFTLREALMSGWYRASYQAVHTGCRPAPTPRPYVTHVKPAPPQRIFH